MSEIMPSINSIQLNQLNQLNQLKQGKPSLPEFPESPDSPHTSAYDVNTNTYHPSYLSTLCSKLESMSKINQVEILRIFHKNAKNLVNENQYGVHINVTDVDNESIQEINDYLVYIDVQEKQLAAIQTQQCTNKNYIINGDKDKL
jgi:hypothetical protein